jgi:hypothetical protein
MWLIVSPPPLPKTFIADAVRVHQQPADQTRSIKVVHVPPANAYVAKPPKMA